MNIDKNSKHLLEMHHEDPFLLSIEKFAKHPRTQKIENRLKLLFQFV